MWLRAFLLLFLLAIGPAGVLAAPYCEPDESCCAREAGACPALPGGECSMAAAVSPGIVTGHADGPPVELGAIRSTPHASTTTEDPAEPSSKAPPGRPRFLLFRSLLI